MGLKQHLDVSTHAKVHTLDLIITRSTCTDSFIHDVAVKDMLPSDHFRVHCKVNCAKPGVVQKEVKYGNLKKLI